MLKSLYKLSFIRKRVIRLSESYQDAAQETIYCVSHKAGRIKEVRWMKVGTDLRAFDGTYVCENKTVTAHTIIAGGWNIQREHTRVLIK